MLIFREKTTDDINEKKGVLYANKLHLKTYHSRNYMCLHPKPTLPMSLKLAFLFVISCLFASVDSNAQVSPPPMAMPKENNIALVDKIIEVTKHEQYFRIYCIQKVKEHAQQHKWKAEKTNEILESIQFKYYNSTIYNSYAWYSKEQLEKLLDVLVMLNNDAKNTNTFVLTNVMMQHNLDGFVKGLIEGNYVVKGA
jgi:hypothetical protein